MAAQENFEATQRKVETFRQASERLEKLSESLGTEADKEDLRRKVTKEKKCCDDLKQQISSELQTLRKSARELPDGAFKQLTTSWGQTLRIYEKLRKAVEAKEQELPPAARNRAVVQEEQDHGQVAGHGNHDDITAMLVPRYDTSALHTEEQIQIEKRRELEELEGNITELHSCYQEFSALVDVQGGHLEVANGNVDSAIDNVQKGTEQIKEASKIQKSSRKKMCCIIFLLLAIIIVIVVVVMVAK